MLFNNIILYFNISTIIALLIPIFLKWYKYFFSINNIYVYINYDIFYTTLILYILVYSKNLIIFILVNFINYMIRNYIIKIFYNTNIIISLNLLYTLKINSILFFIYFIEMWSISLFFLVLFMSFNTQKKFKNKYIYILLVYFLNNFFLSFFSIIIIYTVLYLWGQLNFYFIFYNYYFTTFKSIYVYIIIKFCINIFLVYKLNFYENSTNLNIIVYSSTIIINFFIIIELRLINSVDSYYSGAFYIILALNVYIFILNYINITYISSILAITTLFNMSIISFI